METWEPLSPRIGVWVNDEHRFNTDSILLAWYSLPRAGEACADFGTGCGVIPLLWCDRAGPAQVYAVELQQQACELARRSAQRNGFSHLQVLQHDLRRYETLPIAAGSLDSLACNPPYKAQGTGVQNAAAAQRLARHETALCFSDIAAAAKRLLRFGGRFTCCQRPERLCDVLCTLREFSLEPKRLRLVQQRPGKAPFLFLLQAARGGKPGLSTEPTLFVENPAGGWSDEMLSIYGEYKQGHIQVSTD